MAVDICRKMIAPLGTLKGVDTARIGLDPDRCRRNATRILRHLPAVRNKVMEVFTHAHAGSDGSTDPDRMLYSGGFIQPADRHLLNKILAIAPKDLGKHLWSFQDERLQLMLFRYRARNFPNTLNEEERRMWDRDRRARLVETEDPAYFTLRDFERTLADLRRGGYEALVRGFPSGQEPDLLSLLDIVGLATVCDVVPLTGLNRARRCP